MKPQNMTHRLAVVALIVLMIMSIHGVVRSDIGPASEHIIHVLFGFAIWGLLIWKIWNKPRELGLWVGIFLFLVLVLQIYLWRLAICGPRPDKLGAARNIFVFALQEVPLVVALVCCLRLRWCCLSEADTLSISEP